MEDFSTMIRKFLFFMNNLILSNDFLIIQIISKKLGPYIAKAYVIYGLNIQLLFIFQSVSVFIKKI